MKNFRPYIYFFLILLSSSCGNDRLHVDTSSVTIPDVKIDRLEQDLFRMDTSDVKNSTKKLIGKYGKFYSTFVSAILNNGGLRDSSYAFQIRSFIRDQYMRKAFETSEKKFPDMKEAEAELTEVYKRFAFHFPKRALPKPITMISGFNYSIVVVDSTLAMGLESYLGRDNEFYTALGIPKYKSNFMNRENMLPDAVRQWMLTEFPNNMSAHDFLSEIVYMGKIYYLSDALLPDVTDTLKIQYTVPQMEYCRQNEFNVWGYFAAQKLLYTTDQAEIAKFTSDGPFTSALSKEAPARIGHWIGWQIVRQFMKNNPDISLEDLMNENDAQKILAKSKYKPGK
ncbi:MAG: hypothetical protein ACJ77K_15540 [Bacteroidia bacterium]